MVSMNDPMDEMKSGMEAEQVLSKIKRRSELFETAIRPPPTWYQFVMILMAIALVLYFGNRQGELPLALIGMATLLFLFIATNIKITNRRIDAIITLLGEEKLLTRGKEESR
jgi:hypothetical protein